MPLHIVEFASTRTLLVRRAVGARSERGAHGSELHDVPGAIAQGLHGGEGFARAGAERHAEDSTAPTQKPARID